VKTIMSKNKNQGKKTITVRMCDSKKSEDIKKIIEEAEKDVGVKSDAKIPPPKRGAGVPDGMVEIGIELGKAFIKAVVDKYGDKFVSWLSKKLHLDEKAGEKASEAPKI
jgi:hypothetical protein